MKQYAALDDTVYFWFAANDTSGSGGDGATPAADVRLAGAAADAIPVYSPTPVLLTHANYPAGAHEIAIVASAGNGFAVNNTYAVFCTLAIDGQNPTGFVGSFDLKPVEANVTQLLDTAWLTPGVAGTPDVNAKLLGGTAQTGNDVGADVNSILEDTGTTLDALIKDVPTVAEFEARSILSADYVVVGDTIAGVTAVTNDVGITQAGADKVWGTTARALTDKVGFRLSTAGILAIWHQLTANIVTADTIGKLLKDDINTTISSRSSHAAADIWSVVTRALTDKAGFALSSAAITAIFNKDISAYSGAGYAGTYLKNLYDSQGNWITATGFATSGALATAQSDLDIITGASGVVIQDGTIVAASLGADCITNAKIADNAIAVENIKDSAISAAKIATDAITATKIAANAIGSSEFAQAAADKVRASVCVTGDPANSIGKILHEIYTNRLTSARAGYLANINNANLATIADISTLTATEIAYLNAAISSRSSHTAANVRDAILDDATRFSGADIAEIATKTQQDASFNSVITEINANETKIDALPTKTEQDTSFNTVITDIGTIDTAVGALPTKVEQDASFNSVITEINANETKIDTLSTKAQQDTSFNSIPDLVWDEILTGATHNIATSAGKRLRQIAAYGILTGTAQAGTSVSITLAADADGGDGIYNRNLIVIVSGTGVGQTRTIADYNDTTKVCIIDREWRIHPNDTSEYQILADDTPFVVDHGVARGGTETTIILRDYASSTNDIYLCNIVIIIGGTGRGQSRLVGSYDGSTKAVTICGENWATIPDTTSVYAMIPYGTTCTSCVSTHALAQIADAAWDELQSGHTVADSFGKYLDAAVSGVGGVVGSGALSCTWTQKDKEGQPMDNVKVWITTDEAGTNVIAGTLLTNAHGKATFMLDAGTYYVFRERAGYNFTNPQEWSVS